VKWLKSGKRVWVKRLGLEAVAVMKHIEASATLVVWPLSSSQTIQYRGCGVTRP
jgi:hypothetical protein